MPAFQLGLVLALLAVCTFTPGFFFLRRLRWSPMEKLCGSIGLSLILLYLASWAYYCLAPGSEEPAFWCISVGSVALGVLARRDLLGLVQSFSVRRALLGYSILLLSTLLILSMIRNYSGAAWYGDWLEHFQRTLFFLNRFPPGTPIFGGYLLPARPPMMNVLAAFFLAQTADRFEIFQIVFTFLNLLAFLPCCLIMPALAGPGRLRMLPLAVLFALNPIVMQAATYTWTKSFAAFFVVLALWFYLAGWRKNDCVRMTAAFVALSAGLLVHYSAGPYCVFVGLHYLLCVFRKRERRWRELTIVAAACSLLLLTWFGWSINTYGTRATFTSNTSVTLSRYSKDNWTKIVANIYDSVLPRIVREPATFRTWDQPNLAGAIRDNAFIFYQTNVIFGMGLTAGPLVLGLLYRAFRHSRARGAERWFWLAMIPFCVIVGIAVVGERDPWGTAHLTLLPLEILGISMLAASFPLRRMAGVVLIAGCIVDFSLGVFLQARVENMENSPQRTVFPALTYFDGRLVLFSTPDMLSASAWTNWRAKHQYALEQQWLRQIAEGRRDDPTFRQQPSAAELERVDDNTIWGGWYSHHGGSASFLGDRLANSWFGGLDAQSVVLLLLFMGLIWLLWKEARPA